MTALSTLPLIAHRHLDAVVAWRGSTPVSVRQFLGEVEYVAGQLPPGRHVLNLCGDRYRFTVALAACIVSGRVSLLPSTHTPEMVRQMQRIAPDVFCIADQGADVDLPTFRYPESMPPPAVTPAIPDIDCAQVIAQVFTSGSTGVPVPHVKRWGSLVRNVRAEAQRLGIGVGHAILGTVPPQHMYGLESTVLMPLQSGAALHAGRPFYPADICAALASLPRPRVLVTTPYHLRALLTEQATLPAVDQLLSATAPLSQDLAEEAENRFGTPLHEIYGCTETGQLASRRTTAGLEWQTLSDIRLRREGQTLWAEGGHIDRPTCLADVIELTGGSPVSTTFLLHGRHADQVNIAGKRTSLAYLNHQLNAIPGVQDGIFLLPQGDSPDSIHRLTALVVAPGLIPSALTQALRERIDPVFLPRPLLFVDALPRNATGKLPSQITQDLLTTLQAQSATREPA
ncbi:AMP-binding protein [Thiobacillus denitrificans]|uniref:Beta-hydroxyacyl-ACP dehydratase n=1 Tax=Thiobacillus denitrificans TaxID=36861 RepID=A0A119CWX9_THIDE|nr:AMP-binding protein [Thiobacillus denitrificans]KVW97291.1 beta-hydroxyacyl-ACP dehydratase [Thiobacillus denitrificans]